MRMAAAGDLLYGSYSLQDILFEIVERRGTAGEVAERMAAEFVAFPEKSLEIRSTKLPAEAIGSAHQPHGSIVSTANAVVLQDCPANVKCRLRKIVKRKRHHRTRIREREIAPVGGKNCTPSDCTQEMAKRHVRGNRLVTTRLPPSKRIKQPTQLVRPAFMVDG